MKLTLRGKDGQQDYCRPKQKKLDAFTKKIREILKRNRDVSIQRIVAELNAYLSSVEQIRASMEKATPPEDIEQIPIWRGKTDDFCRILGLR